MADQTNAEVSDERLRELSEPPFAWVRHGKNKWFWRYSPPTSQSGDGWFPVYRSHEAALNRRSVTSQASEGAELTEALTLGWWNSKDLKLTITETGEVMTNDREALRAIFDALPEVPHGGIKGFDVVPAAPVSKRVERLETIKECAKIAHTAHLQCVDERDRIRQNTPEFGYAQAKVEAVTAVWHRINELLPKEPSSAQALGGRS